MVKKKKKKKIIMIMIDEEKKLTTISLSKTPKHERSSVLSPHPHTVTPLQIMKLILTH
jgi:hypothetical protein